MEASCLFEKKELTLAKSRSRKEVFLCASAPLRDKQKKIRIKPASGRPTYRRQAGCKGFNLFAPLGKKVSAQRRQAAKGFFLCPSAPLRAK